MYSVQASMILDLICQFVLTYLDSSLLELVEESFLKKAFDIVDHDILATHYISTVSAVSHTNRL